MPRVKIVKVPKKLNRYAPGGPILPGTMSAAINDYKQQFGNMGTVSGTPVVAPAPSPGSFINNQQSFTWSSFPDDINGKPQAVPVHPDSLKGPEITDVNGKTINNPYAKPPKLSDEVSASGTDNAREAIAKDIGIGKDDRLIGTGPEAMRAQAKTPDKKPKREPFRATGDEILNVGSAVANYVTNYKQQKDYNNWAAAKSLPDNYYAVNTGSDRGWYDKNDGMFDLANMGYKGTRKYGGMIKAAEGVNVPYVGQHYIPAAHIDLPPGMMQQYAAPAPRAERTESQQGSSGDLRDVIAAKESGGNYEALPKKKDGTLASSAVGKYQFLWNSNKDWIQQVTGVDTKTGFMHNPEAQEKAFDYWDKTVLTPNAMKIKQELGVNAPIENIKYAIHFAGPTGAYKYFATGKETNDVFGTSVGKIMNMDLSSSPQSKNQNNMKIRIVGTPGEQVQMAGGGQPPYSGQTDYGLYVGQRNLYRAMPKDPYENTTESISEKPENEDNPHVLEAEGGETIARPDGTHMEIKGKRHTNGGVKLNSEQAPEGSFIFSDTKKMKIKDPNLLKYFGKGGNKALTPAEIAKQYDVNKFRGILSDPNTDALQKNTAKRMLDAYDQKLAELALVQEGKKGFPQGVPDIAKSLVEKMSKGQEQMPDSGGSKSDNQQEAPEEEMMEQPVQQRYGGGLRRFQGNKGGSTVPSANAPAYSGGPNPNDLGGIGAMFNRAANPPKQAPSWWQWWTKSNTPAGKRSPAKGLPSTYDPNVSSPSYEDYEYWRNLYGRDFEGNTDQEKRTTFQKFMFPQLQKGNPAAYQHIMDEWGQTAAGKLPDSVFGARTAYGTTSRIPGPDPIPNPVPTTTMPPGVVTTTTRPTDMTVVKTTTIMPGDFTGNNDNGIPYGWTQQDINNRNSAVANLALIKKYHMASRDIQPDLPEFVPVDWRGQAAALQSAQNAASSQLGTYLPGQSMASNLSALAGQQAENLGKAISSVDQYNAQGKTASDLQRSNILNTFTQYNAGKRDYDMDYENTADSKYRAALAHAGDRLTAAKNQGITNAGMLYDMNVSESPEYYISPRYQIRNFNSPQARYDFMNKTSGGYQDPNGSSQIDIYNDAYSKAKGSTPAEKHAAALKAMELQASRGKSSSTTYPYNTRKNNTKTTQNITEEKFGGQQHPGYAYFNPFLR